jgi:P pilus assembly chaperone PapD
MQKYLILLLGFLPFSVVAEISLSDIILDFKNPKEIRKDITVSNIGKSKTFVAVDPFQVKNPGADKVERIAFKDPRKAPLIITPGKLILNPKQKRNLRFLVNKRLDKTEQIFRVRVVPKSGKLKMEKDVKEGEKATGVKILVGYDVLVIVRPKNIVSLYKIERKGKELKLQNTGNTNFLLVEYLQCDDFEEQKNCERIKGPRIYAGTSKKINLARNAPVQLIIKNHVSSKIEIY